jgi:hypothetical protein
MGSTSIAHQVGQHEIAIEYIGRAIGLKGNAAGFHSNLSTSRINDFSELRLPFRVTRTNYFAN